MCNILVILGGELMGLAMNFLNEEFTLVLGEEDFNRRWCVHEL